MTEHFTSEEAVADISKEMAVRDAFEKHWMDTRGKKKAFKELQRHTLQPQCYVQDSANRHWVTWQAAYKLGRNAGLDAAKDKVRIHTLGQPLALAEKLTSVIESLKDNTP